MRRGDGLGTLQTALPHFHHNGHLQEYGKDAVTRDKHI